MRHLASLSFALILCLAPACAGNGPRARGVTGGALRESLRAPEDPTVRGSRLLPEWLDEGYSWGVAPGGGLRAIIGGVRVVSSARGAIAAATERLPAGPAIALPLPRRMGGGFLFALGKRAWRSESWLAPLVPLLTSATAISEIFVGLDRVYARSPQGILFAFDPLSGAPAALGPLPRSPNVGRLAALDAWNAVAIADLLGVLVTRDAGVTWQRLSLPFHPKDVAVLDEALAVGGTVDGAGGQKTEWFAARMDGEMVRLPSAPSSDERADRGTPRADPMVRPFGQVPLADAIADGWPLVDGTALLARDGVLARVRLTDGAIVERVPDAFPLAAARCHPLSRARSTDLGGLAFVCGEPAGRTVVYDWDALDARLVESRRFDGPREVLAFGNGALAARGPCAPSGRGDSAPGQQVWCTMSPAGVWSETTLRGDGVDRARVVVLADNRLAVLHPPTGEDLATAGLTLMKGADVSDVSLVFPTMRGDVAQALRRGLWMDGFEERRPGVLGGWVDAAGSLLGIEVATDGTARIGEYIRDAGGPIASGRWAFGWTASRRGFETTDGGMTWVKGLDLPEPISSPRGIRQRACGPLGCIAAGWLRVGWGPGEAAAPVDPPAASQAAPAPGRSALTLECEPLSPAPIRRANPPATSSARQVAVTPLGHRRVLGPRAAPAGPPAWGTVSSFSGFAGHAGPKIPVDDVGVDTAAALGLERGLHNAQLARLYAWGPGSGDWDLLGRWQVRWQSAWGGGSEARSSAIGAVPWTSLDEARRAMGIGPGLPTEWALATEDDPNHALLVAHHPVGFPTADIFVLETGVGPAEIHRSDGEAFPDVEAAVRTGGRWYVATIQGQGEAAATVFWLVEGAAAREILRVPRLGFGPHSAVRLARRANGQAIGLVVDGQGDAQRGNKAEAVPMRWVAAIDLESHSLGEPEPLAPLDFSGRGLAPCSGDDTREDNGWELDVPYAGSVILHVGSRKTVSLQSVLASLRLTPTRACVARLLGSADASASLPPLLRTAPRRTPDRLSKGSLDATILSATALVRVQCTGQ